MKHKIFINKQGILELIINGNLSGEELNSILDEFAALNDEAEKKNHLAYILADASNLGRARPDSRKKALNRLKSLKRIKMAVYGVNNPYAKYVTRLAAKAIGMPNLQFFDSREAAEEWIFAE